MLLESSALKWRISQTQFIYLERTSIFLGWTVQIKENQNSLKEKNEFERFSTSEQLLSSSVDLFFMLSKQLNT